MNTALLAIGTFVTLLGLMEGTNGRHGHWTVTIAPAAAIFCGTAMCITSILVP